MYKKRSFFEKLTGGIKMEDDDIEETESYEQNSKNKGYQKNVKEKDNSSSWAEEDPEEGQLTVDVYQTAGEIVVQTMVAGVRPEDLQINITRDMITIKGKREENKNISEENYFAKELYWGAFSRSILLPQEVEPEDAEAIEKHGLLIIKIPKIDKSKRANLKVKSI